MSTQHSLTPETIISRRLHGQRIDGADSTAPESVVAWLGALQAQDYEAAKWAIGLRSGADLEEVEAAIERADIVRTWLMRGTLHIVSSADLRWMLALLAPRLVANSARRYQQLDLDDATLQRACDTFVDALQGGRRLTRAEMFQVLEQAGISIQGQRGYHMLRHAGLCAVTCHGPKQGKQETFVLLEEWVPPAKGPNGEEAVIELAWRYFRGHGPAALGDFVWWSGLRVAQARSGIEGLGERLNAWELEGQTLWAPRSNAPANAGTTPRAHLLPAFDEYYLGYQDRSAVLDPAYDSRLVSSNGMFRPAILFDGQVAGIWKQARKKDAVTIEPEYLRDVSSQEDEAVVRAAKRYGGFLGRSITVA